MNHKCEIKSLKPTTEQGEAFKVSCGECSFSFEATSDTFAKAIKIRHETLLGGSK
jgi:hypothetical protein